MADVHIPKADRKKLDAKSELCYFVSYCETQKAYRFWSKSSRKNITSRDATFHEFSQSPASLCVSDSDDDGSPNSSLYKLRNLSDFFPSGSANRPSHGAR